MTIVPIAVCVECTDWLANADPTGLDYSYEEDEASVRLEEIQKGEREMIDGGYIDLCYDGEDMGFSINPCDCCGTRLYGARIKFNLVSE